MLKPTLKYINIGLIVGGVIVSAAALLAVFASRQHVFAQDSASPAPDLIGRWAVAARGYGFENANDSSGKPMYQAFPEGQLFLEITDQTDRSFAGRYSCPQGSCDEIFAGSIGEGGEILMIVAATSNRTIVSGKLSAGEETLRLTGQLAGFENQAISSKPGIGAMSFTARKLK